MQRGIRGATRVDANDKDEIMKATRELVLAMTVKNEVNVEDISFLQFTLTEDLDATFPSTAVRDMGKPWSDLPSLDMKQANVPGAMDKVIRALMVVRTDKDFMDIIHPYLRGTQSLRPDRSWD